MLTAFLVLLLATLLLSFGVTLAGRTQQPRREKATQEGDAEEAFERGDQYYKQWLERYPGGHIDHNPRLLAEAMNWLEKAADNGSASAQFYLGYIWFEGHGRLPDYEKSAEWFARAAGQGDADAMVYLALQYAWGWGVKKDRKRAAALFEQVESLHPRSSWAIGALASAYYEGRGVKKDVAKAAFWYEKNARTGDVLAQYRLGQILMEGKGLPKDLVGAYFWFSVAARNEVPQPGTAGPNKARWMISPGELKGRVEKRLTPEELAKAEELLQQWRKE